jgi:hypothetical protein
MATVSLHASPEAASVKEALIARSLTYDWKERNIAHRFAGEVFALIPEYGSDTTLHAISDLMEEWKQIRASHTETVQRYGAGLEFLFAEMPLPALVQYLGSKAWH